MENNTIKAILFTGVTVLISVVLIVTLYCLAPHSNNGFGDQAVDWGYIPLIQEPYTFNENGPYMSTYKVRVDTENRCVWIGFLIEGENEICDPDETIIMSFNGDRRYVYRAPFQGMREFCNEIAAYKEQVKDGSYVYTSFNSPHGLTLYLFAPMEGIFRDPADLNTMTIGFEGIYDVKGNPITTDEGHSNWIFIADRDGRIVPRGELFYVDTEELNDVTEGAEAKVILIPTVDGVEFCSMDETSENFRRIMEGFSLKGMDADVEWSRELDDNGEETVVITLKNIRNIRRGDHELYIPANLAFGWREGIHCTSGPINKRFLIHGKEEDGEY